ncbi:MAG: S41 family peptidase [Fidelibacterota bacterium]
MRSVFTTILVITLVTAAFGKDSPDCPELLNRLISKIEQEYPGFKEKTKDQQLYENFKREMKEKSQGAPDSLCLKILREYLSYFKDHHLYITGPGQQSDKDQQRVYKKISGSVDNYVESITNQPDSLEGIWESSGYTVGLIKSQTGYQAFIIEADTTYWKPGEIKFEIYPRNKIDFYLRDHSLKSSTYEIFGNSVLAIEGLQSPFIKTKPSPSLSPAEINQKINEIKGFYIKEISDETSLIKLSNFFYSNVTRIHKMIDDNINLLKTSGNLIIDLRNNPGGTDQAYQQLLPYICTQNIRMMNAAYLATPTLINGLQKYMDDLSQEKKYDADRKRIRKKIKVYKNNMYEFVNMDSSDVYIQEIEPVKESPENVVILINERTASAAESLTYRARQSKKVKIMGTPSGGVLDYGSTRWTDFGSDDYKLSIPTFRSLRLPEYPIDNIGLQPDIYLDESVTDWIQYARNYLENR